MRTIRITLAQINTTVGDIESNVALCTQAAAHAESYGSDLVVFPELTLTGYPPEDLLLKPGFLRKCREELDRFVLHLGNITAVVGFAEISGSVYNSAAVVSQGAVHCSYRKMFLPNYGVFDEKRYFSPGTTPMSFMLGDVCIGITICEDIWMENGPCRRLCTEYGADVIINLSASPFHAGKFLERADMLAKRSGTLGTPFVYVNLVGGQDELVFDGGSLVFDGGGKCIARSPSFAEHLNTIDLSFEKPFAAGLPPSVRLRKNPGTRPDTVPFIAPSMTEEEEVFEALVTGTRDYLYKNGFSKAVIGLSGGIDSALVAAIAAKAIGRDNVIGVTMPSHYTSEATRSDAGIVADNLGIRLVELPITRIFDEFCETLAGSFTGSEQDVTEENLQARIRGTLLMALSNKFGWLVLTTGNKSEMATGYATLYGDMAGGFAVIKDVPKLMVYRISRLINTMAGKDIIPETIISRPPTAELRPDQKDSDSLPPYDVLDGILRAYIEEDMSVDDIVALGFERDTVRRVVRLCDTAEYKRRQAPPGVKITPRAFGRDRRLPITNRFKP